MDPYNPLIFDPNNPFASSHGVVSHLTHPNNAAHAGTAADVFTLNAHPALSIAMSTPELAQVVALQQQQIAELQRQLQAQSNVQQHSSRSVSDVEEKAAINPRPLSHQFPADNFSLSHSLIEPIGSLNSFAPPPAAAFQPNTSAAQQLLEDEGVVDFANLPSAAQQIEQNIMMEDDDARDDTTTPTPFTPQTFENRATPSNSINSSSSSSSSSSDMSEDEEASTSPSASDNEDTPGAYDPNAVFDVKRFIKRRPKQLFMTQAKKWEYLVRWGPPYNSSKHDTWEPDVGVGECKQAIADLERREARARRKKEKQELKEKKKNERKQRKMKGGSPSIASSSSSTTSGGKKRPREDDSSSVSSVSSKKKKTTSPPGSPTTTHDHPHHTHHEIVDDLLLERRKLMERKRSISSISTLTTASAAATSSASNTSSASSVASLEQEEDDSKCHACNDGNTYNNNEIVCCDGCGTWVHQMCYAVDSIPKGDWFCHVCSAPEKRANSNWQPTCIFCPIAGGAMMRVYGKTIPAQKQGQDWAHLACALFMTEVDVETTNNHGREPGIYLNQPVIPIRFNKKCYICGQSASQKTGGKLTGSATIQCWYSSCKSTWFHVLCARKHGLPSGIKDVDMEIVYPDGEKDHIVECIGYAFCAKHCTKKWDDDDFITTKIEIWKRRKEREKAKLRPPPVKRVHIPTYWEMEFAKAGPPKDREEQLSRSLILAQEKAELARKAKEEKKAAKKNEPATPRSSNASSSSAASVVSASNSVKGENEDMMEMDEVREIEAEDEDNSDEEEGQQESSNQNGSTVSFDALSKDTVVSRPTTPIVSSQPPAASSTTTLLPTTADVKPVIRPLVPPAPVVRIPRKSSVIATPAPGLIALGSKAPPKSPVASLTVTALPPSSSRMAPVSSNSSTKEGDAEFSKIMSVLTAAKSLASRSAFLNKYFLSLPKDHPSLTDFGTKFMVSGSPMSGLKTLLIWIIDLRSAKNKSGKLLKDEALLGRQIIDTLLLLHSANPTQVVWAQERDALFKVLSQVCDKESQQLLLTLEKALFGEGGANERLKSSSNFVHVKQEPSHAVDAAATSSSSSSSVITTQADEDEEDDEVQIRHVTTSSSKFHTIKLHHRAQPHHHHTAQTAETEVDDPVPEFTSSKPDAAPKKSILKKTLTSVASWDFINKRPRTAPAAADNAQQLLEQTIAATGGPSPSPVPVVVKTEVAPSAAAALALLNQQSITNPRLRWIPEPGLCAYQPAPSSYIDDHEMDTSEDTVSVQSNPTHAIAQRAHRTSPSAAAAAQQQLRTVPATAVSVSLTDPVDYSMMPSLEAPHSSSQSAVVESHDSPHPSSGNSTEISAVPVVASCVALAAPEPSAATSPPTAFSDTSSTYGKLPDVEIYGDDEKALDYIFANRHCDICQCIVPRYGEAMHLTGKRHQTAKATFLKQIEDEGKAKEQEKQKRLEEEQKNEEKKKNDAAKQHQSANEKGSDNNPRRESESARRNDARYSDRERERDRDSDRSRSREDDRDRERKRDRYRDRDYDNEYSRSRSRDVDRDRERDRDREEEERRRSRSRESYSTSSSRSHSASSSLSPSSSRSGFASRFPSDYDYDRNKDRDQDREYNAYRSSSRSGNASSGSSDRDRDRDQTQSRDREPPHWVSNSLCHFYKNGKNNCRYGDKCRYKHESSASNSQVTNHQQKSVDSKSATVTSSSSSSSASSSSSSSSSVAAAASSSFASSTTASPRSASASIAATTTTIAQTGTTQVDANASREDSNTTTFALSPHTAPISGTPVHALVTDNAASSAAAPTDARGLVHLAEAGTAVGHTSASESATTSSSATVTGAPPAPAGVGRCLFYRSQAGCMRGNQCRLQHI